MEREIRMTGIDSANGWIKLYRRLLDSSVWRNRNHAVSRLAIYCLLRANHSPAPLAIGEKILNLKPGQFLTSLHSISEGCLFSIQQTRTALKALVKLGFLTEEATDLGRKISITNWDSYQSELGEINIGTNNQPTSEQQPDNTKQECKKKKKKKTVSGNAVNPWALWVEVNREFRRKDPVAKGPDLRAAKELGELVGKQIESTEHLRQIMVAFLSEQNSWLNDRGYALQFLVRDINKYLNMVQPGQGSEMVEAYHKYKESGIEESDEVRAYNEALRQEGILK